jgi:hypothetical protein
MTMKRSDIALCMTSNKCTLDGDAHNELLQNKFDWSVFTARLVTALNHSHTDPNGQ